MFSFKQFLILLIAVTVGVILYNIWNVESKPPSIEYSSFLKQLENREIDRFISGEGRSRARISMISLS
jgi:hypothetical protein